MDKEARIFLEAKWYYDRYYSYWLIITKKELISTIILYRTTWLDTVKVQIENYYKRKWLKQAYKERFVKNIFDRIYIRWI